MNNLTTGIDTKLKKYIVPILFPIVSFILLTILLPNKISFSNVPFIIIQSVMPAVIAWGACFSMTIGNQNFSTGACVITAAIIGGNIAMKLNMGIVGIIIFPPLVGMICGIITGGLFVALKIPSMIVSIGVMLVLESICSVIFDGSGIYLAREYVVFGNSINTVIYGAVIFVLAYILYNKLPFGYHVRAIGSNVSVAKLSGLNVYKARFLCFLLGGLFAGFYATLSLGTTSVQRPVSSMGSMKLVFDAMMCVFVGTSLGGAMNLIPSIFIGSIMMQMLQLTLTAVNFPSTFTQSIIALVVLIAMCYSSRKEVMDALAKHKKELELAAVND
jgi:ribose transport system permease protein